MYLNELKQCGLFSVRVDLSEFFDSEMWIELREPNEEEGSRFDFGDIRACQRTAAELLDTCIVGHPVEREEGKKASNKEVADLVRSRWTMTLKVVNEWLQALRLPTSSEESSDSSEG